MAMTLYWVETGTGGRLATTARPRAGDWLEDEVRSLKEAGVHEVVSLLTREEEVELGLEAEQQTCLAQGLAFRTFRIHDRQVPQSDSEVIALVRALRTAIVAGRSVVVHCRMGIGRSSLIAAAVLRGLGVSAELALERLGQARGLPVPDTEAQRRWIEDFTG